MVLQQTPRILVVEDDVLLGSALCALLEEHGFEPVGPAATVADAVDSIETEPLDAATLDIQLADASSFPIGHLLIERHIPFLFFTATPAYGLPEELRVAPLIQKPGQPDSIVNALKAIVASGVA